MDVDDGFGVRQAPREPGIIPLQDCHLGREGIGLGSFGTALARRQRTEGSGVPLPTPVGEGRRVQALATQDGTDASSLGRAIGFGQNAQLVLHGEGAAPWAVR